MPSRGIGGIQYPHHTSHHITSHHNATQYIASHRLQQELFDLDLHAINGALELGCLVGGDGARNYGTRDSAGASKGYLAGHKDVWDVLVFAQEGQVKQDFDGLGVGGHDDELGNPTIESLGGFVGSLLGLLVVRGLLDEIQEGDGQVGIGKGESFLGHGGA
eukprot:CAMPEP_0172392148 /NCGR_PEP_ID=MMETSP1061-20121228/8364_1 /TAXON_ID=37318 /ORGANISM="Pseudo-nitzschia pungens, Strain cf. pungens" /LENGTH=160 /DNA_ID=CAMNT_0013122933 /DNA_START=432 /DNA_END=914 /DNA_ORIENTATION=+